MNKKIIIFLASAGFAGHIPLLAGTLGSMEGVLISLIFNSHLWLKCLAFIILFISGVYLAGLTEKISGIKDDHSVVIDEVIGAVAATFFLPPGLWPWIFSLVAFRILDWTKPFPLRRIEKLPGGVGVVGDDVVAGLYSLGLTWVIYGCRAY